MGVSLHRHGNQQEVLRQQLLAIQSNLKGVEEIVDAVSALLHGSKGVGPEDFGEG